MSFRRALIKAASQALSAGEISRAEFRKIWFASWMPGKLDEIEGMCWDAACAAGHANGERAGFDWQGLLDFLKELMPIIAEWIKIFTLV